MCTQSHCGRIPDLKLSSSFQFSLMFHFSSFVYFDSHLEMVVAVSNYLNLLRVEALNGSYSMLFTHPYTGISRTIKVEYRPWNTWHYSKLAAVFFFLFWRIDFTFFLYKLLQNAHKNTNDIFYDIVIVSEVFFFICWLVGARHWMAECYALNLLYYWIFLMLRFCINIFDKSFNFHSQYKSFDPSLFVCVSIPLVGRFITHRF